MQKRQIRIEDLPAIARVRIHHPQAFDAVAMLVYMAVVYVWFLGVYPTGRDFAHLANAGGDMPFLADSIFALEMRWFGTWPLGYHLVNLALLYGCMIAAYYMVSLVLPCPVWLGSLAAILFMANPVHTEAVLNLSGVADLIPCLAALTALAAYMFHCRNRRPWKLALAVALFALAVLPYPSNAPLVLVVVLFELHLPREQRKTARLAPLLVITLASVWWHRHELLERYAQADLAGMFAPLYFIFYPFGFLPENARLFHQHPWLGWLAAVAVAVVVTMILRKARRNAILLGLLAMLAVRLVPGDRPVDPVHLVGGGQLLLANVLFCLALVALFRRMMDHPKWRRTIVSGTTFLCVVFFIMQICVNNVWRQAGERVEAFLAEAERFSSEHPGESLGILPDYRYMRGAPLCLSEAVAHETPFGGPVSTESILRLDAEAPGRIAVTLESWSPQGGVLRVQDNRRRKSPFDLDIPPYRLACEGGLETDMVRIEVSALREDGFTLRIRPKSEDIDLPRFTLPLHVGHEMGEGVCEGTTPPCGWRRDRVSLNKTSD